MRKLIKQFCLWFSVLLLTGCGTLFEQPQQKYNIEKMQFQVTIHEAPKLKTNGLAMWNDEKCIIFLKEYPKCLKHEMRHCIEGHFHDPKIPNGEDCD